MASLEEPLIPTPSNTGVQNFIAGFSMVAAANHRKEQEQIAAQRLIEKAAADHENYMLRSQIAAQNLDFKEQDLQRKLDLAGVVQENKHNAEAATAGLTAAVARLEPERNSPDYATKLADLAEQPEYQAAFTSGMGHTILNQALSAKKLNERGNQIFFENAVKDAGIISNSRPFIEGINSTWAKEPDGNLSILIPDRTGTIKIGERAIPDPVQPGQVLKYPVFAKKVILPPEKVHQLQEMYKKVYPTNVVGAQPDTSDHGTEWARAKAALKLKDPAKVKQIYSQKGYDPSELDSDSPP